MRKSARLFLVHLVSDAVAKGFRPWTFPARDGTRAAVLGPLPWVGGSVLTRKVAAAAARRHALWLVDSQHQLSKPFTCRRQSLQKEKAVLKEEDFGALLLLVC
ncbi:Hypothetical predicted protein [Podarcis lilfordi]|uniref:Uncharacterized protein n=1 Tax=Podarcis lilfordi TaxID=74358 RepID=A0AA35PA54_9SAUR|nr:Hypothetical predicted protein [Podarcis lilfordi]